jgi:hypothetical protein
MNEVQPQNTLAIALIPQELAKPHHGAGINFSGLLCTGSRK